MKQIGRKTVSLGVVVAFIFSFILFVPATSAQTDSGINYFPIDMGSTIRNADYEILNEPNFDSLPSSEEYTFGGPRASGGTIGTIQYWMALDNYNGVYFFTPYVLMGISDNTEIWVQYDLSYPVGDPRETPVITDAQIAYILEEFDTNIYPTDVQYFGEPNYHDGSNSLLEDWGYFPEGYFADDLGRNVVLVSNIQDENYYNPDYPYFVAGFYSPSYEAYFDRNVITIDSLRWDELLGPDGSRPYLFDSVFAHEYQHLIHDDWNPNDDTFMNEGCSMYAEPLCGYPMPWTQIGAYLASPDNSLTVWNDQGGINTLSDYGQALLWTLFLSDHYGGADFISHFVKSGIPGITGINAALSYFGYSDDFNDVFYNWRMANLLHTNDIADGKYNYKSIDLADAPFMARLYELPSVPVEETSGSYFGNTFSYLGDDTGISAIGPYGTDYIKINAVPNWDPHYLLSFDGDDSVYIPNWVETDYGYYSGAGDLLNSLLAGEIYVDSANPVLSFWSFWDIEDYWDFGFVQISEDNGETWNSLEYEFTTYMHDPSAHPAVIENLPGITGYSGEWKYIEIDLSAYAGDNVMLGFRYITDWATHYTGWYVDDVEVSGTSVDLAPIFPAADFMITLIEVDEKNKRTDYTITDIPLDALNDGSLLLHLNKADYLYILISPIQKEGTTDYSFAIESLHPYGLQYIA